MGAIYLEVGEFHSMAGSDACFGEEQSKTVEGRNARGGRLNIISQK